jgi:hypothetical protein
MNYMYRIHCRHGTLPSMSGVDAHFPYCYFLDIKDVVFNAFKSGFTYE